MVISRVLQLLGVGASQGTGPPVVASWPLEILKGSAKSILRLIVSRNTENPKIICRTLA
jgi:hypothetical protein